MARQKDQFVIGLWNARDDLIALVQRANWVLVHPETGIRSFIGVRIVSIDRETRLDATIFTIEFNVELTRSDIRIRFRPALNEIEFVAAMRPPIVLDSPASDEPDEEIQDSPVLVFDEATNAVSFLGTDVPWRSS